MSILPLNEILTLSPSMVIVSTGLQEAASLRCIHEMPFFSGLSKNFYETSVFKQILQGIEFDLLSLFSYLKQPTSLIFFELFSTKGCLNFSPETVIKSKTELPEPPKSSTYC